MDLRKSDSYVSCIKIRGVPIIPPLMTDDVRSEMRYYKGLALAVQERLMHLENSVASVSTRAPPSSTYQDSSSRTAKRLDTNVDGETDYPDETGACGSESPDVTTGSIDLTPGSADMTASTDVNRYLLDLSLTDRGTPNNQETSAQKIKSQQSVNIEAQQKEGITGCQASLQQNSTTLHIETYQRNDIEAQPSGQENKKEDKTQHGEPEMNKTMNELHAALETDKTMNALHTALETDKTMNALHTALETDKTMEMLHTASEMDETTKLQPAEPQTDATIKAQPSRQGINLTEAYPVAQQSKEIETQRIKDKTANIQELIQEPQPNVQPSPDRSVPESRRAQVPKSLDIVPITLDATKSSVLHPSSIHESGTSTSLTESDETTPKLVRQGSYVLETPSPMLLARMRQGDEEFPDYAPTSREAPRRRAWNISEARSSWELQDGQFQSSNKLTRGLNNSRQMQTTPSKRRVVGSADCIRSMVERENRKYPSKTTGSTSQTGRRNVTRNGTSILGMANKLGGSLGNLGRRTTGSRASRSADDVVGRDNFRTKKLLASVTTEKILDVFERIRSAHEKQMSQLLTRQRREQRDMQREFETQTRILVAQIERTFPGVRLPEIDPGIAESTTSPETEDNENGKYSTSGRASKVNGVKDDPAHCPLNGILPCQETPNRSRDYPNDQRTNDRRTSRQLFPVDKDKVNAYGERHVKAATVINAYARGYLVRRLMRTERVLALKTTYGEALRCMLRLHVDAPLALPELNFHQRLQLQCDAASMNIVELFAQEPGQRMEIIKQDREVKRARRQERPNSARSCYSFATQRTLARKKLKEMGDFPTPMGGRSIVARSRCQTWTSNAREKGSPSVANQGIKRSTSAGAVRKPWR